MDKYEEGDFSLLYTFMIYYGLVAFFTIPIVIFVGSCKFEEGMNWFASAIFIAHRIAMLVMAVVIYTRLF